MTARVPSWGMTSRAALLLVLLGFASAAGAAFTSEAGPAPSQPPPLKYYDPLP